MDVRNDMEELVRDEVRAVRDRAAGSRACWCPLCETDVVALALTLLPPLYTRLDGSNAWSTSLATTSKIHDAVQAAAKRVTLRPKHPPGRSAERRGEVGLVNYTFEVGLQVIGSAMSASATPCACARCRDDTLAYALNRYPAKYGVSTGGRRSLHPTYLDFMRHELGMLVTQAARLIGARPRH